MGLGTALGLLPLLFVPLAAALRYGLHASAPLVFAAGVMGIGGLALWMKRATEHLSVHAGAALGGLINVSLGSLAELVLALFVLARGEVAVVRGQIVGSIIATSLLGLGLAAFLGGIGRERQRFGREAAARTATMLVLVVVALLLPAVVDLAQRLQGAGDAARAASDEALSLATSGVLLVLYGANLAHTLLTRRDPTAGEAEEGEAAEEGGWGLGRSLLVLVAATLAVAGVSELVSDALADTADALGLGRVFVGVVALAVVGTSADLFAAVGFARQDRMGLAVSICLGSAVQVALVLAPLLVLLSWALGRPMNLVFGNPLDLFAVVGTTLVVNVIAADGETNWFEGLLLVGVYLLLALGFFFLGG